MVADLPLTEASRILEPSFGTGSFLVAVVERLMELGSGTERERFRRIMSKQVFGVEIDPVLYGQAIKEIEHRWGPLPSDHNLTMNDFFRVEYLMGTFDVVVGNPPYGGTFDPRIEDRLDCLYGRWNGHKLKKETYSFFIARSLDWLAAGGTISFVSSDTFTTISTMGGLRRRLMDEATVRVTHLSEFSDETKQPVLIWC
jgi:type I restriction-modification system DNA methylase subunit